MLIPDPVIIGYPAPRHPLVIGKLSGHDLKEEVIYGHRIIYSTFDGDAVSAVQCSWVPSNPKRQELVTILRPDGPIPDELWECVGFERIKPKGDGRTPPTPCPESFVDYLARRRRERVHP